MKKITKYQIYCGINHPQYLSGQRTVFTEFSEVVTGIGDDYGEAIEDALDQIAQKDDFDVKDLEKRIREELGCGADWPESKSAVEFAIENAEGDNPAPDDNEMYYVSILYNQES